VQFAQGALHEAPCEGGRGETHNIPNLERLFGEAFKRKARLGFRMIR
jgi:hypothetical protein